MRADVEDDPVGIDRLSNLESIDECLDRFEIEILFRRCKIDQVDGVTNDDLDAGFSTQLLEALEVRGVVVRWPPCPGALSEDLRRLSA